MGDNESNESNDTIDSATNLDVVFIGSGRSDNQLERDLFDLWSDDWYIPQDQLDLLCSIEYWNCLMEREEDERNYVDM